MKKYEIVSQDISKQIKNDRETNNLPNFTFDEDNVVRRNNALDRANIIRTAFMRDIDKIIYCPYYNRYADKTQVFSFYKNDDITRRGLHVQLVSRIARTIGKALNLNLDLIEAIALGHDIGHTPFGHAGEEFLDKLFYKNTKLHFSHNIHSVRVLDKIFPHNISLQTLNGIASHDGEFELCEYRPQPINGFEEFDKKIYNCYLDKQNIKRLFPDTLEGCVVRISDIIAYLGKDRQDAEIAHIVMNDDFEHGAIGIYHSEMINRLIVNIVENSYGKPYIKLDDEHFDALKKAKRDNYEQIYLSDRVSHDLHNLVMPMMSEIYDKLLDDLIKQDKTSPVFTHHIDYVNKSRHDHSTPYELTEPNQIVVDYIASMTDDYFIDLYAHLFPNSKTKILYKGYFD